MSALIIVKELRQKTGCSIVDCKKALDLCNDNEGVAYEYLRLKGEPMVRQKIINGKWVNWSDKDYVSEAKRKYLSGCKKSW